MFVDEGNRYLVRGDIAFAQSIIETGWFNFPDYGHRASPSNNNFAGIGACRLVRRTGPVRERAQRGACADPAAPQLRRQRLARQRRFPILRCPSSGGATPATAAYNFDHFFAKGHAPLWNNMGNGNWADSRRTTRPSVLRSTTTCSRPAGNRVSARPMSCSSARSPRSGPCPVELAPTGPRHRGDAARRLLRAERRRQRARGTTAHPRSVTRPSESDLARDIAVMPDGDGYVVLTGIGTRAQVRVRRRSREARAARLPVLAGQRPGAVDRDHARRRGLRRAPRRRQPSPSGAPRPTGPLAALAEPGLRQPTTPREHRGHARRRRLPGARPARRRVRSTAARHAASIGAASTPYFGIDVARDIVLFAGSARRSATTCSTAGAGSGRPSRSHRAGTRAACCSPTVGAASRSSAANRSPSATTAPPSPRSSRRRSTAQRTTTERSTSPRSILWNASSTSSSAMVSLTNRSRSSRPSQIQVDEHREVA